MKVTEYQFKMLAALADLAGLPQRTGLSPAECAQAMIEVETMLEEREQNRAAAAQPPSRPESSGAASR